ncbi:MAG: GvpL/GvpF family gas vesicle protein [Planctomycetes bacterium]|nr:GvpL/GvpF family gas vesicle protein [Planctomycetota bacterium]MBL7184834.1 GvpL/GvpF family gas vesicle protein [Phycisphaerae bacterium]
MTDNQLVYLYCVANEEPKLAKAVDLAEDLYLVCHRALHAVVGEVDESEFGAEGLKRNMADLEWIKTNASAHEKVIEQAMINTDVIPFKFGTLFATDESLKMMLEQHGEEFKAILERLANKQEWGLKIYCDLEKLRTGLLSSQERILKIDNEIKSSSVGKAYLLKKKKDEMIEQTLNERINKCGRESFESLKESSCEARINRLLPKEVTEREDEMVLNSAFLVGKDKVGNFIDVVDTLKMRYEQDGLFVDCTGPWPAYNFCGLSDGRRQNE